MNNKWTPKWRNLYLVVGRTLLTKRNIAFSGGNWIRFLIIYINWATAKYKSAASKCLHSAQVINWKLKLELKLKLWGTTTLNLHNNAKMAAFLPVKSEGTKNFLLSMSWMLDLGAFSTTTYGEQMCTQMSRFAWRCRFSSRFYQFWAIKGRYSLEFCLGTSFEFSMILGIENLKLESENEEVETLNKQYISA